MKPLAPVTKIRIFNLQQILRSRYWVGGGQVMSLTDINVAHHVSH